MITPLTVSLKSRQCLNCKSTDTRHAGPYGYAFWYKNEDKESTYLCAKCYDHKRRFQDFKKKLNERYCSNCGSHKTLVSTNKYGYPYNRWTSDKKGGWFCNKCYNHLVYGPKRYLSNQRQMKFMDKKIMLPFNPRKGVCQWCGKKQRVTHMHHAKYHVEDPLKDTIELCVSCHRKETIRLSKLKKDDYS